MKNDPETSGAEVDYDAALEDDEPTSADLDAAGDDVFGEDNVHYLPANIHERLRAAKSVGAAAPELPERLPDPHGMAFTDAELDALTDTDNEESVKLAMGTATPEKRALLGAKPVKAKE